MDNFDIVNADDKELNKPMPIHDETPIPFDVDEGENTSVSHAPLNLGGAGATEAPKVSTPKPAKPAVKKIVETASSSERITNVRTFFTKLHVGSLAFLDEQISQWLKDNPGITIKRTNTATGIVVGKKDEPSIMITVWY